MSRDRRRQDAEPPRWGARSDLRVLNTDVPRLDGPAKATGRARYTHDVRLPGMVWGRVLCSPYPVARPTLDVEAAQAVPGVVYARALTDGFRDGFTTWLGQPVAVVVGLDAATAGDGLRALAAEWELGEWAVTEDQATAAGAPRVGRDGNVLTDEPTGDLAAAEAALAAADAVVEGTWELPVQSHASLETHGVVVDYTGGDTATLYSSTQFTHGPSREASEVLGLGQEQVVTLVEHMGGGFGSKLSGLDLPGRIACEVARELRLPLHLMFQRFDEFVASGNRSGSRQVLRGGASADGRLVALVADVTRLGGVGRGSHPGHPYIYSAGAHHTRRRSVFTNTDGSRPMRAPGHPQASFAIEGLLDELAYAVGVDPLTFRKRNLEDPVYHRQLDRVAAEIGWAEHPHKTAPPARADLPERAVGIGFAVTTWGTGGRPACQVDVRIAPDGGVTATVGAQDLGTGTRTYVASIVAEELGLAVDAVTPRIGDSRYGYCVASGGSVTTPSLAPAVKDAAHRARLALFDAVAPVLGVEPGRLALDRGQVYDVEQGDQRLTWREACAALGTRAIEVRGEFVGDLAGRGVHGAQAAKVEVDTLTGEVRVLKMVAIQDVGLCLNRMATRSQIQGGMVQALSYGLFEERVIDPALGLLLNGSFEEYRIAGTRDVPELVALIDDDDEREVVLGVGEPPVIPGQSAIAGAIHNACGVRLRSLPLSPTKLVEALWTS